MLTATEYRYVLITYQVPDTKLLWETLLRALSSFRMDAGNDVRREKHLEEVRFRRGENGTKAKNSTLNRKQNKNYISRRLITCCDDVLSPAGPAVKINGRDKSAPTPSKALIFFIVS